MTDLSVLTSQLEMVALAASKAKYLIPNGDWNAWDHPRDPNTGEFVELNTGTFLFGKTKAAYFSNGFKIEMKPGDTVYQTPVGNIVIVHANGEVSISKGGKEKPGLTPKTGFVAVAAKAGKYKKVGSNPGTKVKAKNKAEAANKVAHPAEYLTGTQQAQAWNYSAEGFTHTLLDGDKVFTHEDVTVIKRSNGIIEYFSKGLQWVPEDGQEALKGWFDNSHVAAQWTPVDKTSPGASTSISTAVSAPATASEVTDSAPLVESKHVGLDIGGKPVLTHPFSEEEIPLGEYEDVYQHKKFDSFILLDSDYDTAHFVNQKGKYKKADGTWLTPPADTLALLDKNYTKIWSGKAQEADEDASEAPKPAPFITQAETNAAKIVNAPKGTVLSIGMLKEDLTPAADSWHDWEKTGLWTWKSLSADQAHTEAVLVDMVSDPMVVITAKGGLVEAPAKHELLIEADAAPNGSILKIVDADNYLNLWWKNDDGEWEAKLPDIGTPADHVADYVGGSPWTSAVIEKPKPKPKGDEGPEGFPVITTAEPGSEQWVADLAPNPHQPGEDAPLMFPDSTYAEQNKEWANTKGEWAAYESAKAKIVLEQAPIGHQAKIYQKKASRENKWVHIKKTDQGWAYSGAQKGVLTEKMEAYVIGGPTKFSLYPEDDFQWPLTLEEFAPLLSDAPVGQQIKVSFTYGDTVFEKADVNQWINTSDVSDKRNNEEILNLVQAQVPVVFVEKAESTIDDVQDSAALLKSIHTAIDSASLGDSVQIPAGKGALSGLWIYSKTVDGDLNWQSEQGNSASGPGLKAVLNDLNSSMLAAVVVSSQNPAESVVSPDVIGLPSLWELNNVPEGTTVFMDSYTSGFGMNSWRKVGSTWKPVGPLGSTLPTPGITSEELFGDGVVGTPLTYTLPGVVPPYIEKPTYGGANGWKSAERVITANYTEIAVWDKNSEGKWVNAESNIEVNEADFEDMLVTYAATTVIVVPKKPTGNITLDSPKPDPAPVATVDAPSGVPGVLKDHESHVPYSFEHPVSGYVVDLPPGTAVYQHKKSPDSYIIEGPNTAPIFLDKNGTPKNPPSHVYAKLHDNFTSVFISFFTSDSDDQSDPTPPTSATAPTIESVQAMLDLTSGPSLAKHEMLDILSNLKNDGDVVGFKMPDTGNFKMPDTGNIVYYTFNGDSLEHESGSVTKVQTLHDFLEGLEPANSPVHYYHLPAGQSTDVQSIVTDKLAKPKAGDQITVASSSIDSSDTWTWDGALKVWKKPSDDPGFFTTKDAFEMQKSVSSTLGYLAVVYKDAPKKKGPAKPKKTKYVAEPKKTKPEHTMLMPWGAYVDVLPGQTLVSYTQSEGHEIWVLWHSETLNTVWRGSPIGFGTEASLNHSLTRSKMVNPKNFDENYDGVFLSTKVLIDRSDEQFSVSDFEPPAPPKEQTTAAVDTYTATIKKAMAVALGATKQSYYYYGNYGDWAFGQGSTVFFDGENRDWSDLTTMQRAEHLVSMGPAARAAEAALDAVKTWDVYKTLSTSEKSKIGKERNRYGLLAEMAEYAAELLKGDDSDKDEEWFSNRWIYFQDKNYKGGVTWGKDFLLNASSSNTLLATAVQAKQEIQFAQSVKGLGFDPFKPTFEQTKKFGEDNGEPNLLLLNEKDRQTWILKQLGYPLIAAPDVYQMETSLKKLKQNIAAALLLKALKAKANKKKQKNSTNIPSTEIAGIQQIRNLFRNYEFEGDISLSLTTPGLWLLTDKGEESEISDTEAVNLVNSMGEKNKNIPSPLAYGRPSAPFFLAALEAKYGTTLSGPDLFPHYEAAQPDLKKILAGEGAKFIANMSPEQRWLWLRYHLVSDQIGKFSVEKQAAADKGKEHPEQYIHPGSPDSEVGKKVHQALGAWVASQQTGWSTKLLDGQGLDPVELQQGFNTVLPLPRFTKYWDQGLQTNDSMKQATFDEWAQTHPNIPKPTAAQLKHIAKDIDSSRPADLSIDVWQQAKALTKTPEIEALVGPEIWSLDDQALNAKIETSDTLNAMGLSVLNLGSIPIDVRRWLAWTVAGDAIPENYMDMRKAISALTKAGYYLDEKTPTWIGPNGQKYSLSPGTVVRKRVTTNYGNDKTTQFLVTPPTPEGETPNSGVHFTGSPSDESNVVSNYWLSSNLGESGDWEILFAMPSVSSFEDAQVKNPGKITKDAWAAVEAMEIDLDPVDGAPTGADLTYGLKHDVLNEGFLDNYESLALNINLLPDSIRQYIWANAEWLGGDNGPDPVFEVLEYKSNNGHFISMQTAPLFDGSAPYAQPISMGLFSAEDITHHWPAPAVKAFIKNYSLKSADEIPDFLANLLLLDSSPKTKEGILPSTLQLTEINKKVGGMHSKRIWLDQNNNEWMTKAFDSDPNAKARVDAEHIANVIGKSLGFRQPQTRIMDIGGHYAYVQHMAPALDPINGIRLLQPKDLSLDQLKQAMEEHVLDWVVSNHDSHGKNLLQALDGTVFGIDKGQSFKFFPNDKLAAGYLPPGNGDAVWYDRFYTEMKSGSLGEETVNAVAGAVLRKASKVSKRDVEAHRAHLTLAMKNRKKFPGGMSREEFIDAAVERKQSAFDDFYAFYENLYKASPYTFPFTKEGLQKAKIGDHTHVSVTDDLAEEIVKTGAFGKALFFDSADIEEAHLMLNSRFKGGARALTGEMKLRKDADAVLVNWLQQQTIEGGALLQGGTSAPSTPAAASPASMPGIGDLFSKIIASAKTVNAHQADGQYNSNTIANSTSAVAAASAMLTHLDLWEQNNPHMPFQKSMGMPNGNTEQVSLLTAEQQDAWKAALLQAIEDHDKVMEAYGNNTKVPKPNIELPGYTPTSGLNISGNPEPVSVYNHSDGWVWTIYDDGGVTVQDPDGKTHRSSKTDFTKAEGEGGLIKADIVSEDPETEIDEDLNVGVQVQMGVVPTTVTKRKMQLNVAALDTKTGELTETGEKGTAGHNGYMYEIEFGDTVVQYMPWAASDASSSSGEHSKDGVPRSHQGLLRFEHVNWNGDSAVIEQVLGVITSMGVDVDEADETSLELYYWRHMAGVIADRKDGQIGQKYAATLARIKEARSANPDMTKEQELAALREAWALTIGQDAVDKAKFLPEFSHHSPNAAGEGITSGHPWWWHPEFSYEELRKVYGTTMPSSSLRRGEEDAVRIAYSGAALSTEERMRVLGQWIPGMSSAPDQRYGSGNFVFTRQNKAANWGGQAWYHPRVIGRTSSFSFNGDEYGKVWERSNTAFFDISKSANRHGGTNELMVKHSTSVFEDMVALVIKDSTSRSNIIKFWNDRGVTKINGLPLSEFFVPNGAAASETMKKVWAQLLADEKAAA